MDIQQTFFGAIIGLLGILSVGYLIQSRRANKAENAAHDYEYKEKVEAMEKENAEDPIDKLIHDFDSDVKPDGKDS